MLATKSTQINDKPMKHFPSSVLAGRVSTLFSYSITNGPIKFHF